jgi:hypothetical protein
MLSLLIGCMKETVNFQNCLSPLYLACANIGKNCRTYHTEYAERGHFDIGLPVDLVVMFDQLPHNLRVGRIHRLLRFFRKFCLLARGGVGIGSQWGMDSNFRVCWFVGC